MANVANSDVWWKAVFLEHKLRASCFSVSCDMLRESAFWSLLYYWYVVSFAAWVETSTSQTTPTASRDHWPHFHFVDFSYVAEIVRSCNRTCVTLVPQPLQCATEQNVYCQNRNLLSHLSSHFVPFPRVTRSRYACLGVTDRVYGRR